MLIDRESMLCRAKEKRQKIDRKKSYTSKDVKNKSTYTQHNDF